MQWNHWIPYLVNIRQNIYKRRGVIKRIFNFFSENTGAPRVTVNGYPASFLSDTNSMTCGLLNRGQLNPRMWSLVIEFAYDQQVRVNITGQHMSCGTFGAQCDAFPTTLVAQGRDQTACVGAPLCGQAYKCPFVEMNERVYGLQECIYSCPCEGQGSSQCRIVVMFIGNGSVAAGYNTMRVCEIALTI